MYKNLSFNAFGVISSLKLFSDILGYLPNTVCGYSLKKISVNSVHEEYWIKIIVPLEDFLN